MSPCFSANHQSYCDLVDTEFFPEFFLGNFTAGIGISDISDFFVIKLCKSVRLSAASVVLMPLLAFVLHVVIVRSNSKMVRIAARRTRNAGMQNKKATRRIASTCNYPCYSMGVECSHGAEKGLDCNLPIPLFLGVGRPWPAFFSASDFNVRPKTLLKFLGENLLNQCLRYNLCPHNISCLLCLLCHAFGCLQRNARALSF